MISVCMSDRKEREEFALEASRYFEMHPEKTSYTTKDIEPGCLFALRFGLGGDCVVVFKIDEFDDIENYQNIIK